MKVKLSEQVSDSSIRRNFTDKLKILMRFTKGIIQDIRATRQDLIDAGVYLRRMDD